MKKYIIISLILKEEILADLYDIEFNDVQELCKKAISVAKDNGVELLFKESHNDRLVSESFALIEYNFDITIEDKSLLIGFVSKFFNNGTIKYRTMNVTNTLKYIRFLKTEGEIINT